MNPGISSTSFEFQNQTGKYTGKVREVYEFGDSLAMITTDRISAFDVILPRPIPFKGQVLNQIASKFLESTSELVPNWVQSVPHPNVTIGHSCKTFPVEMVIRGYLAGHAWREYKAGKRLLCGNVLPEGLKENDKLPEPIITPTTKASEGHDEDITRDEILSSGLVEESDYRQLEEYTHKLFQHGTAFAKEMGLILVDTKYEFGKHEGEIYLIDEIHTPDSSRYFYADTYESKQAAREPQRQLSKEFVREWLMDNGFQGKEGQDIPKMDDDFVNSVSERYIELFEKITGDKFVPENQENILSDIEQAVNNHFNLRK